MKRRADMTYNWLLTQFQEESNRIEGIDLAALEEVAALGDFLKLPEIRIADLCNYVNVCAGPRAVLRNRPGLDVWVGEHTPPPGGEVIAQRLDTLLTRTNAGELTPYEAHHEYESLHPFIDGNGRSGRALWAWMMVNAAHKPTIAAALGLGFLHAFYYQALAAGR